MGDLTAIFKANFRFLRRHSTTASLAASKAGRANTDSTTTPKRPRSLITLDTASTPADNGGDQKIDRGPPTSRPSSVEALHSASSAGPVGKVDHQRATSEDSTNTSAPTSLAADNNSATSSETVAIKVDNNHHSTHSGAALFAASSPYGNDLQVLTSRNSPLPSIHEHPSASANLNIRTSDLPASALPNATSTSASAALLPAQAQSTYFNCRPSHGVLDERRDSGCHDEQAALSPDTGTPTPLATAIPFDPPSSPGTARPIPPTRRQSILSNRQTALIRALLTSGQAQEQGATDADQLLPISPNMVTRKIWVKRPNASATLITINEDDLVDDVRELILRKYANSLGRQFDAPDLTLRIVSREPQHSTRLLQPDEPMGRTLDAYYPGGQTVDEALLIDVPSRRTPKASPNPRFYADDRPHESGNDYFPPYPPITATHAHPTSNPINSAHNIQFPPSMAILGTGQLPPLPSPGGSSRRLGISGRPKMQRMHTASPVSTATNGHVAAAAAATTTNIGTHTYSQRPARSRTHSAASSDQSIHPPAPPPMPTPPGPTAERVATPPPRVASPRPSNRPKKSKKNVEHPSLPPGMLNGAVPPINVLIVEDNIINLKLLEAFVKRLKVRWQTAMNGREAVTKWRAGGFHLVLMDIQLPVMNGLEATREIRRLEKVNSIGVFSSSASSAPEDVKSEPEEQDKLVNTEMFKSPVIIVALTASSLQSDRHEALAAGCNDFLTKPVNFVWLERKVMEWGCMQALIDFDGWRKWKDFSQKAVDEEAAKKATTAKAKTKKNRLSMTTAAAA